MRRAAFVLAFAAVLTAFAVPAKAQCTDADADGYFPVEGCGTAVDCNDAGASIHPGASETCNAIDDDCDGTLDEGCDRTREAPVETVNRAPTGAPAVGGEKGALWTGTRYGLVWLDYPSGSLYPTTSFRTFDASGQPASERSEVCCSDPSIAWTGNEFGLVRRFDPTGDVRFSRYSATGEPVGTEVHLWVGFGGPVAWNGTEYGIAFYESGKIRFARIGPDGTLLAPPVDLVAENVAATDLIWNGTEYGLLWTRTNSSKSECRFARVLANGTLAGAPITFSDPAFSSGGPSLVWASGEWAAVWLQSVTGGTDVFFRRISAAGSVAGPIVRVTSYLNARSPSLAWTGAEYGLAFVGNHLDPSPRVVLQRLDREGDLLGGEVATAPVGTIPEPDISSTRVVATGSSLGEFYKSLGGSTWVVYFSRFDSSCTTSDADGDTFTDCAGDCDDADGAIYPGAPETCDGKSNDCGSPTWPRLESDWDRDGDHIPVCAGDCDDTHGAVYDGAPQLCDGLNNDCGDPSYPVPPANEADGDGDGVRLCGNDCDDANPTVYPGAIQACDGINNDCDDPLYPTPPANEADADTDGVRICSGDCDDGNPAAYPGATEVCDAADNDCDALIDEDAIGEDTDGDGVRNLCDNCPTDFNSSQLDADTDGAGNVCDNCITTSNPDQADADTDTVGDLCDNCPVDTNANQADADADGSGDVCDCAIADPETHPGAPEVNDGLDNQCFGDDGFGLVDETSGDSGFHDAIDKTRYSWPQQQGATEYEAVRSESAGMGGPCASTLTTGSFWIDGEIPLPGGVFHYLNRPTAPHLGSWGADSAGTERVTVCP